MHPSSIDNIKNYIIYLPQFQISTDLAKIALDTGTQLGWELYLFIGVDGRTVSNTDDWYTWGIKINKDDDKCKKMLEKPGVRGCFLSHYSLWKQCIDTNETIGIFEHDVEFIKGPPDNITSEDLLKLEGFEPQKPRPAGNWYEGARAYILTPDGANKLVQWVEEFGCLPADVMIGDLIVKIDLDHDNRVKIQDSQIHITRLERHTKSFTWNLEQMC